MFNTDKYVILCAGKKRHGKDTFKDMFTELVGEEVVEHISFAAPIKTMCDDFWGVPRGTFDQHKDDFEIHLVDKDGVIQAKKTARYMLQRKGTEESQELCGRDIWVKKSIPKIKASTAKYVVITDTRFVHEPDLVKRYLKKSIFNWGRRVVVVGLERVGFHDNKDTAHLSEMEIGLIKKDFEISVRDGDLSGFRNRVKDFISYLHG